LYQPMSACGAARNWTASLHAQSAWGAIDDRPRKRHHVRFWGLSIERAKETLDTAAFWLASTRPAETERAIWVGAATKDVGMSLTRLTSRSPIRPTLTPMPSASC
jgi:hypothetical protein